MPAGVMVNDDVVEDEFVWDLQQRYSLSKGEQLTANQRLLYVLWTDAIAEHREPKHDNPIAAIFVWGAIGPAMAAICFFIIAALYYSLHWLLGAGTDWVLYLSVALVIWAVLEVRKDHREMTIGFARNEDDAAINRLNFGRLHNVLERDQVPMAMLAYLAGLIGLQAGLWHYTSGHLGVEDYAGWQDGFGIACDNLCRGIFFDVFDIYGLYVNRPFNYTVFSATVLIFFRTAMNLLFVYSLYLLYQWLRLGRFFKGLPKGKVTSTQLIQWMNRVTHQHNRWSRIFFDEFVFFMICLRFLSGQYDHVRLLTRRFPRLRVESDLRRLFVSPSGDLLFEGYRP